MTCFAEAISVPTQDKVTGQVATEPCGTREITGRMQFSHESTMGDRVKNLL